MTHTTTDNQPDPAAIEENIRRTQEDMSRTVDKIGNQLSARNIFNALLDKADENNVDARMLIDGARRNPVALGLIAAGAIWLVSDKDSKFPTVSKSKSFDDDFSSDHDIHHRDYVSHMSSVEMGEGEDYATYQRRRDIARANFLMVERDDGEDESGFRQRLDSMTDSFRQKRRAWSESSGKAGSAVKDATREKARMAATKTQDFYDSNPLVGGILAAAVGAALGSGLPITRKEQDTLGSVGEKARDLATEQKDQITSKLAEAKDQVLEKADEKLQQGGANEEQPRTGQQTQPDPQLSRI